MATYIDLDSVWRDRQTHSNPMNYSLLPSQVSSWSRNIKETKFADYTTSERSESSSTISVENVTVPYPRIELFGRNILVDSLSGFLLTTSAPHLLNVGDVVSQSSPMFTSLGIQPGMYYYVVAVGSPTTFSISPQQAGPAISFTNFTTISLPFTVIVAAELSTTLKALEEAKKLCSFSRLYLDIHCSRYNDPRAIRTIGSVLAEAKFVLWEDKIITDSRLVPTWIIYKSQSEQTVRFKRDDTLEVRFFTRSGDIIDFYDEPNLSKETNPDKQTMVTIKVIPYTRDGRYTNQVFVDM